MSNSYSAVWVDIQVAHDDRKPKKAPRSLWGGETRQQVKVRRGIPVCPSPRQGSRHRQSRFGAFAFQTAGTALVSHGPEWAARQRTPVARGNVQHPTSVPVATGKDCVSGNGLGAERSEYRHLMTLASPCSQRERWVEKARTWATLGELMDEESAQESNEYALAEMADAQDRETDPEFAFTYGGRNG